MAIIDGTPGDDGLPPPKEEDGIGGDASTKWFPLSLGSAQEGREPKRMTMRSMLALAVLLTASLPAAYAQDGNTEAQLGAPALVPAPTVYPAYNGPPLHVERIMIAGRANMVQFWSYIWPDCASRGPMTARLDNEPKLGKVEFEPGEGFSNHTDDRFKHCNTKRIPGLVVKYGAGKTLGLDTFDGSLHLPDGTARKFEFRITVIK
jgi:hypothetical protein